jgi:phosphoserine phosphatase
MADEKIQGEGDYVSGKTYQDMQHEFARKGDVEQKAREAEEALDGPEGAELEEARRQTGEGKSH